MKKYNAILFDVDGTLIDSAPGIIHTIQHTFSEMGIDDQGADLRKYVGPPLRRTFGEYLTSQEDIEKAIQIYRKSYKEFGSHECTLYPGVIDMLSKLKDAGYQLYTATSKPVQVVTPILEEQNIADFFHLIGGASMDLSRDTKSAVMEYVIEQTGLPKKEIVMVGDRFDDMVGAREMGVDAIAVLYGYGSREELEQYNPITYITDCDDLCRFLAEEC